MLTYQFSHRFCLTVKQGGGGSEQQPCSILQAKTLKKKKKKKGLGFYSLLGLFFFLWLMEGSNGSDK